MVWSKYFNGVWSELLSGVCMCKCKSAVCSGVCLAVQCLA